MQVQENPAKNYKQISIRLPIEVHKALTIYCVEKGIKVGPFIRELIEQVLNRKEESPNKKRRRQ